MINENGQSYLEVEAIQARKEQMERSDYNQNNEYSESHPDALSNGDIRGKGTGNFGGPTYTVPDMTKPKSEIGSSGFNTEAGGNSCDERARDVMTARSLYSPERQYGLASMGANVYVDTAVNRADGQYDGSNPKRLPYTCPVA